MPAPPLSTAPHSTRLARARQAYFDDGQTPAEELINPLIQRSWTRCRALGLEAGSPTSALAPLAKTALRGEREQNHDLLSLARPIMEHVFEQIADAGSMVILADRHGLLLDTVGDPDFVDRAGRVALLAGATWEEACRGTNAIGTALAEERAIEVIGPEHFLSANGFLTCCASPIFAPGGDLAGVLDISGDYRGYQHHNLGLVRVSSAMTEKHLFERLHGRDTLLYFHPQAAYLGTLKEGLAALSPDGQILAINRQGLEILGHRRFDVVGRDVTWVFENSLAQMVDRQNRHAGQPASLRVGQQNLIVKLRLAHAPRHSMGQVWQSPPPAAGPQVNTPAPCPVVQKPAATDPLRHLNTGDPQMARAIDRARRILDRDIPLLIQGESGVGKEVFARAFHGSSQRQAGPFVALNCAAIPETLIEAELFGYQPGAFTGAGKNGAIGKIQQAHGGTLFLDEIGDMPLPMQARLLRVLQDRTVNPLGSSKSIPVDITLVCATHRQLPDAVARGLFREDLYYRLNGLTVTLPPLRARSDFPALLAQYLSTADRPVSLTDSALARLSAYPWPGNLRQLHNVIRLAIALLDEGEHRISEQQLPDELLIPRDTPPPSSAQPRINLPRSTDLESQNRQAIHDAVNRCGGNMSAAARELGISRATLYRKLSQIETTVSACHTQYSGQQGTQTE